jgi:hypothetical protein
MTVVERVHELARNDKIIAEVLLMAQAKHDASWSEKDDAYNRIKKIVSKQRKMPCSYDEIMWTVVKDMDY